MILDKAFGLILKQEGITTTIIRGDKGGLTKFGIAEASHPGLDVANLNMQQAQDIYQKEYWDAAKCNSLITELQYAVFSCAVNCGVVSAIKILQRACNIADDGIIGPATLAAATKIDLSGFCLEWGLHYNKIIADEKAQIIKVKGEAEYERLLAANETQEKFRNGWNNRITTILNWFGQGLLN